MCVCILARQVAMLYSHNLLVRRSTVVLRHSRQLLPLHAATPWTHRKAMSLDPDGLLPSQRHAWTGLEPVNARADVGPLAHTVGWRDPDHAARPAGVWYDGCRVWEVLSFILPVPL